MADLNADALALANDLNACVCDALDALEAGNVSDAISHIKAARDAVQEVLNSAED